MTTTPVDAHYQAAEALLRERFGEARFTLLEFGAERRACYWPLGAEYLGVSDRRGSFHLWADWTRTEDFPRNRDAAVCVRANRFPIGTVLLRLAQSLAPDGAAILTIPGEEGVTRQAKARFRRVKTYRRTLPKNTFTVHLCEEPIRG